VEMVDGRWKQRSHGIFARNMGKKETCEERAWIMRLQDTVEDKAVKTLR